MDEDHTWSAWSPHSYENIFCLQECYESMVMSRQMGAQTSFLPTLRPKAQFAVQGHSHCASAMRGQFASLSNAEVTGISSKYKPLEHL